MKEQSKLIVFQEKGIRRIWYKDEWWFSVVDVVEVLSESSKANRYWADMKKRSTTESDQPFAFCEQLKLVAADGRSRLTEVANTEGMFRIIQSIPSPKAEPFKLWLAKVGHERVLEIENPELAAERARQYYRDLGYDEKWIEVRIQSIAVRGKLTDEWKGRGVQDGLEYSILTAEISRATFGLTPSEYKEVKGLNRENLRDHQTPLELIFTMLGEESTRQEAINQDAQGFIENKEAAQKGGRAAGKALTAYEEESGQKVVSSTNFKGQIAAAKKQKTIEDKKNKDV